MDDQSSEFPIQLADYLARLEVDERIRLEMLFRNALDAFSKFDIVDLWNTPDLAVTYWILLISGVDQEEEMEIARALLTWKEFSAKHTALLRCIPMSDRSEFAYCSSRFNAVSYPTLIFSDLSNMEAYIRIDPQILLPLSKEKANFHRLLTKLHQSRENGDNLEDIGNALMKDQILSNIRQIYKEIKDFVSVSL